MDVPHSQVIFPSSFGELFSVWSRFPGATPFAGGTCIMRTDTGLLPSLPKNILSLERIDELKRVTRTERYLELGAMVRLNSVIGLGKTVPLALTKTLEGVAGPQLRNIATIGGNICSLGREGGGIDAAAPLAALDARYELRTAGQSRWVSAIRFASLSNETSVLAPRELLTRIRVPLEHWNYMVCRKLHERDLGGENGGVLICTAKSEKDILAEIRLVFAGSGVSGKSRFCLFRDRNSESFLEGKRLPLEHKDVLYFRQIWRDYLSGLEQPSLLRTKLVNCAALCIRGLSG